MIQAYRVTTVFLLYWTVETHVVLSAPNRMAKILQKYVKFTTNELEQYAANPESCVRCVKTDLHLAMGPYGMCNFKHALHELLIRTKVGLYDSKVDGIVLGIRNIKVLGQTAALRTDDPTLHLVINADFYVFRPVAGAVLHGIVRHISKHQISVIIYRVFNTTIRFTNKNPNRDSIVMDQDIKFRIKDFNINSAMPYIEGELLLEHCAQANKSITFDEDMEMQAETAEPNLELNALVELIKVETDVENEEPTNTRKSPRLKRKETAEDAKVVDKMKKIKKIKVEPI